MSFSSL